MEKHILQVLVPVDLAEFDIPSNITEEQLNDSGYTYRLHNTKEYAKNTILERIGRDIRVEIRKTNEGAQVVAKLDLTRILKDKN